MADPDLEQLDAVQIFDRLANVGVDLTTLASLDPAELHALFHDAGLTGVESLLGMPGPEIVGLVGEGETHNDYHTDDHRHWDWPEQHHDHTDSHTDWRHYDSHADQPHADDHVDDTHLDSHTDQGGHSDDGSHTDVPHEDHTDADNSSHWDSESPHGDQDDSHFDWHCDSTHVDHGDHSDHLDGFLDITVLAEALGGDLERYGWTLSELAELPTERLHMWLHELGLGPDVEVDMGLVEQSVTRAEDGSYHQDRHNDEDYEPPEHGDHHDKAWHGDHGDAHDDLHLDSGQYGGKGHQDHADGDQHTDSTGHADSGEHNDSHYDHTDDAHHWDSPGHSDYETNHYDWHCDYSHGDHHDYPEIT